MRMKYYLSLLIVLTFCQQAFCAETLDREKAFAIKGAGAVNCQRYVDAFESQSDEFFSFLGWVDGYLTFNNLATPNTFDVAPWQSSQLISRSLYVRCLQTPPLKFFNAVNELISSLYPNRLSMPSEVDTIVNNGQAVLIYRAIIVRVQEALARKTDASVSIDGVFNDKTAAALKIFQEQNAIFVSGVPDQATLAKLLN